MATAVTVGLLVLDLLVLVLLLELILLGPIWLVRRTRRQRAATGSRSGSEAREPASATPGNSGTGFSGGVGGDTHDDSALGGFGTATSRRRCDHCRSSWVGRPGTDASVLALWLRRQARRRARRRSRPAPDWASRQGWNRCPSCFSRNVRDSRRQEPAAR